MLACRTLWVVGALGEIRKVPDPICLHPPTPHISGYVFSHPPGLKFKKKMEARELDGGMLIHLLLRYVMSLAQVCNTQPRMSDIYMSAICLTTCTGTHGDTGGAVLLSPTEICDTPPPTPVLPFTSPVLPVCVCGDKAARLEDSHCRW